MQASEYLQVIRDRKWLIIGAVLIVTIGAVLISLVQPAMYQGQAVVLYTQRNPGTAILGVPQPELTNFPELELTTQVGLIQQPQIAQVAIKRLNLGTTPEKLLKRLTVSANGQTNMITISAVDSTPKGAASIAGAVADAYAAWSRDKNRRSIAAAADQVRRSITAAQRRIAQLEATQASQPSDANRTELQAANSLYGTLVGQLQQLQSAEELETGSVSIVTSGVEDPAKVSPKPVRNGALGLAVGLILGLAVAFLSNSLDTTIKSAEEASAIYGAPVLGQIPFDKPKKDDQRHVSVVANPVSAVSESYRGLRNSLQFLNFENSVKTLLVTSAVPGEGKSTVAANLAVVLAQAGWRVVLVVADLRRAAMDESLGVARSPGLSEVLAGTTELGLAIQPAAAGLRVLSSGMTPPNPSELLGSAAMRQLLVSLAAVADFIIVDAPPLLAVADAAATARWTDAALVVTREGMTTREAAREAREQLEGVGQRVIGVVVTGVGETGVTRSSYHTYTGVDSK